MATATATAKAEAERKAAEEKKKSEEAKAEEQKAEEQKDGGYTNPDADYTVIITPELVERTVILKRGSNTTPAGDGQPAGPEVDPTTISDPRDLVSYYDGPREVVSVDAGAVPQRASDWVTTYAQDWEKPAGEMPPPSGGTEVIWVP